MIKKLLKYIFLIPFLFLFINKNVFAQELDNKYPSGFFENPIMDEANIFSDDEKNELFSESLAFYNRTGYNIVIHTIETIGEENIKFCANSNYQTFFEGYEVIYILIAEKEGDMIIKYGDPNSEIITDELISVMMMSVKPDFDQGNIVKGIQAALFNGEVLIEENIKLNADTHEILDISESHESNKYIIICTIAAIVFIFNIFYLIFGNKKKD